MQETLLKNFRHSEDHFKKLFEFLPIGMAMVDFQTGKFLEVNQSLLNTIGYTKKEFLNLSFWDITPKKYVPQEKQQLEDLVKHGQFGPNEKEYIKKDGTRYHVKISGFLTNSNGKEVVWGLIEDITVRKQHEIIYQDNKELLEYIAIESSLDKIFQKIIKLAENKSPNILCSILLLDKEKKHLYKACAPSLPDFYNEAINGVEIGENIGSCGSAAYKKQRVIVEDINKHKNWQNYLVLTKKANLRSCWSQPIISSTNEILGTFAIYSSKVKKPSSFEINLIETYSNLASKALEKDKYINQNKKRNKEIEQLFHSTQSGLMYISKDRVIIKANKTLANIFGYKNPEQMEGLKTREIHLSQKRYEEFGAKNFYSLKQNDNFHIEYQLKRKDGSAIWCELSGKALDTQKPADLSKGVLWTIQDISLRKNFQSKLNNSEVLNKNILSTIPSLVWVKNENGVYLSCNKEFEIFFNDSEKNIIGKSDYDLVEEELASSFRRYDKKAIKSKNTIINEESVFNKLTKKVVHFETLRKAMRDEKGNTIGVLGMAHNITKRKQREEELKKLNLKADELTNSQQVLLSLFEKGDSVLFKWNNDEAWSVDYVSSSVSRLFGYTKEEFLSGKICYASCIDKSNLKFVMDEVYKGLNNNLDYFKHEPYKIITKSKEEKWVLDFTVTQKNSKGEITNFIGYITDITEQIQNQEMLYHQSKIASLGEMLGNISHQWRQPLSAISTLATGTKLKKELNILEENEVIENLEAINTNAQYLSRTIDDFRNFFMSDSSIKKEGNLKTALETAYGLVKDSFKTSNIEVCFDIQDEYTIYNENIFIQAILNILNNARDAFNDKTDIEEKYVFINLKKDSKDFIITIEDNAGGIPENIKNKIFEPYFTTKHKYQGTGIGLYMTNQIITKHLKGEISVKNITYVYKQKDYNGASFRIKMPI